MRVIRVVMVAALYRHIEAHEDDPPYTPLDGQIERLKATVAAVTDQAGRICQYSILLPVDLDQPDARLAGRQIGRLSDLQPGEVQRRRVMPPEITVTGIESIGPGTEINPGPIDRYDFGLRPPDRLGLGLVCRGPGSEDDGSAASPVGPPVGGEASSKGSATLNSSTAILKPTSSTSCGSGDG